MSTCEDGGSGMESYLLKPVKMEVEDDQEMKMFQQSSGQVEKFQIELKPGIIDTQQDDDEGNEIVIYAPFDSPRYHEWKFDNPPNASGRMDIAMTVSNPKLLIALPCSETVEPGNSLTMHLVCYPPTSENDYEVVEYVTVVLTEGSNTTSPKKSTAHYPVIYISQTSITA